MKMKSYIPRKLNQLVKIIWEQKSDEPMNWQILPSASVELIFNIGPRMENVKGRRIGEGFNPTEKFCFLSGLHTRPLYMSFPRFHVMGVQMHPLVIKSIFGMPCKEVKDWALEGDLVVKNLAQIEDKLRKKGSFMEKAQWLENFLLKRINETSELHTALKLQGAVNEMAAKFLAGEKVNVEDWTGYSRAQTHRLFADWLGLPPAYCLKLQQFIKSINHIHHHPERLTDIGYKSGYYDQAHFIRSFRDFTNMTPGQYLKHKTDLVGQLSF